MTTKPRTAGSCPARSRPTGSALTQAQQAVLDALHEVYPSGLSRLDLVNRGGHTAPTRAGELRRMGWDIPSGEIRDGHGW